METYMSHKIPSFDESLPMLLLRGRDVAMQYFRPILAEHDLTEQQWRVLRALHEAPQQDISSLARKCHILLPSMSGIIKRLEAKKLVTRRENPHDQRISQITLSSEGHDLFTTLQQPLGERYHHIEMRFGKDKLEQLKALLLELETSLGNLIPK